MTAPSWLTNEQIRKQMAAIVSMAPPEAFPSAPPTTVGEALNAYVHRRAIGQARNDAYRELRTVLYRRGALAPSPEIQEGRRQRGVAPNDGRTHEHQ